MDTWRYLVYIETDKGRNIEYASDKRHSLSRKIITILNGTRLVSPYHLNDNPIVYYEDALTGIRNYMRPITVDARTSIGSGQQRTIYTAFKSTTIRPTAKEMDDMDLDTIGKHRRFFEKSISLTVDEQRAVVRASLDGDGKALSNAFLYFYPKIVRNVKIIAGNHPYLFNPVGGPDLSATLGSVAHATHDIAMEVFLKMFKHRDSFLKVENPENYFFFVARNVVYRRIRAIIRDERLVNFEIETTTPAYDVPEIEEIAQRNKLIGIIYDIMDSHLTPTQRQYFKLSKLDGLRYNDIASKFGVTVFTVKKHLYDAKRAILKALKEKGITNLSYD